MDFNDDDFCYVEDKEVEQVEATTAQEKVNKLGHKLRGPDHSWVEVERFANAKELKDSETAKNLAEEYSLRKRREFDWADVLEYECKYKIRVGFVPCPMKMKVSF